MSESDEDYPTAAEFPDSFLDFPRCGRILLKENPAGLIFVNISRWPKADLRWYLGVRCRKCRMPILFAVDHGEGTGQSHSPAAGKLLLTCPVETCRHQADYTASSISRFQKQAAGNPIEPPKTPKGGKGRPGKR